MTRDAVTRDALGLTPRQREVLALVADGLTDRAIGTRLGITGTTAKGHVLHLLKVLSARNRAHAVAIAMRAGELT